MPDMIAATTARLQREVPAAEHRIDDAIVAMSSLMGTIAAARRDIAGLPPREGQATIRRLAAAQLALVDVGGDVLRVHGALARMGREKAGYDLHECPEFSAPSGRHLHAVPAA
ncbi:MAG: hypothetical protein JNM03_17900 [Sphingopyxis sp.]|jgi:hypothetical protein|uniref:hypothetical protein n=1 Tax=Sphingopyxis sp. TaxID=1908224 RepID=UPI001A3691B5|nr:hypothetical protein [Sphingopyxis sp.]MBL9071860.1 hypothetical protein [Sphingopyxis sp.]